MPVRSNTAYFNNPAFAQAASNLASLFEPPSGADAAGFALADERRQNAQRLQDLFDYSTNPEFNQQTFDRMGLGAGAWAPNQSFYATDQADATKRYDVDSRDSTSRANNRMDNLAGFYDTVAEDAIRPAIPAEIATQFGAPGAIPEVHGNRSPLSETELNALILSGLPENEQRAAALGSTPVQEIIGENGQPEIAWQADSIGKTPYDKPTGGLTVTTNPDGTTTVTQGGSGRPPTEADKKMAFAGTMAEAATNDLVTAFDTKPGPGTDGVAGTADDTPGGLPTGADFQLFNLMRTTPMMAHPAIVSQMTPQGQKFYQNLRVALPYQLMAKSGLAVTEQEYARTLAELVPVPGEDPAVTESKRRQFAQFVATVHGLSGGAWDQAKANPPVPPPAEAATPAPAAPPAPAGGPVKFVRGADGKLIRGQ